MARHVHSRRESLDWKVRRVWVPEAVRAIGPRQMQSASVGAGRCAGAGVLFSPLLSLVLAIPTLLVLVPLRFAGLAAWRVEAVAYRGDARRLTQAATRSRCAAATRASCRC
jgi:hypothetical protein